MRMQVGAMGLGAGAKGEAAAYTSVEAEHADGSTGTQDELTAQAFT